MALSQLAITNAKPTDKPYMLLDGEGLHLQIYTSGSKLWRLRFRFRGKANMMSLGAFPAVSLREAREKRGEIKKQIAAGIDPSLRKKLDKISAASANSFGAIKDFTPESDPHGEHDFFSFEHCNRTFFWKCDYYDKEMEGGSEDPADPEKTIRVGTLMLAEDY
jgi:hypothetical protein